MDPWEQIDQNGSYLQFIYLYYEKVYYVKAQISTCCAIHPDIMGVWNVRWTRHSPCDLPEASTSGHKYCIIKLNESKKSKCWHHSFGPIKDKLTLVKSWSPVSDPRNRARMEALPASLLTKELGKILCCECGTPIDPNPANLCVACLRTQVDITEGIPKQVRGGPSVIWCGCGLLQSLRTTCYLAVHIVAEVCLLTFAAFPSTWCWSGLSTLTVVQISWAL